MIKINFNRIQLLNAVNKAALALPNKSTQVVLEHFLCTVKDDVFTIIACDEDHFISVDCPFIHLLNDENTNYKFCIKGKTFQSILKLINSDEVELTIEENKLTIKSYTGSYTLPILDGDEYLDTSFFTGVPLFLCRLDSVLINEIIKRTGFAYSNDEHRPSMTGYNFKIIKDFLKVATTNSFQLSVTTLPIDSEIALQDIILIPKTLTMISKFNEEGKLFIQQIRGNNTFITFETPNASLTSRLIAEKFPPYEAVVPLTFEKAFRIDRIALAKAIERIQHFTSQITHLVTLTIGNNELIVSGLDEDAGSSADEHIPCDSLSFYVNNGSLKFKAQFLNECLNAFSNSLIPSVTFNWNEDSKPIVINQGSDLDNFTLLMPLKG